METQKLIQESYEESMSKHERRMKALGLTQDEYWEELENESDSDTQIF